MENYLCLLNLEEAVSSLPSQPVYAPGAGADGPLGGRYPRRRHAGWGLPGWLPDLVGRARTMTLADRRGECIYSACQHYRKCFIENTIRRARKADIVIANHALVMIQAALAARMRLCRPATSSTRGTMSSTRRTAPSPAI